MSLEMVPAKVGGDSGASNEPWATGHEQSTQASTATLRAATRHRHADKVNGDTYQPYAYRNHQWEREGKVEKAEQQTACCLKQTAPHTAETSMFDSRNPVCHLNAHDSLTTADQHWLDFNSA